MAAFTGLATSYATWQKPMLPVYLFYSMFGFQRVGDLDLVARRRRGSRHPGGVHSGPHDAARRGTPARRRSFALARIGESCVRRIRPCVRIRVAMVLEDAVERDSRSEPEDRFWYITLYNENYPMPALPGAEEDDAEQREAVRSGVLAGAYRYAAPAEPEPTAPNGRRRNVRNGRTAPSDGPRATLLFSGSSWSAVADARELLAADWKINADSWSVTSYTELRREAMSTERWNRLHPDRIGAHSVHHTFARGPGRSRDRGDRLHTRGARPGVTITWSAGSCRSGRTVSGAPTPVKHSGAISRSTPPRRARPSWPRLQIPGTASRKMSQRRSRVTASRRNGPTRGHCEIREHLHAFGLRPRTRSRLTAPARRRCSTQGQG